MAVEAITVDESERVTIVYAQLHVVCRMVTMNSVFVAFVPKYWLALRIAVSENHNIPTT